MIPLAIIITILLLASQIEWREPRGGFSLSLLQAIGLLTIAVLYLLIQILL